MNNIVDFYEFGDFMIEFDDRYLGCGKTALVLEPLWRDVRRDALLPPRSKLVKALNWTINAYLKSSSAVWDLLNNSDLALFAGNSGGNEHLLRIFPVDPMRQGFEFPRVFIRKVEDVSGSALTYGQVRIEFVCEASTADGVYFTRLPAGSIPANVPEPTQVDIRQIMNDLVRWLAPRLEAIPDRTINVDLFAPVPENSYSLTLEKCKAAGSEFFHSFDFKLSARFLWHEKYSADQKLYECARLLNGYRIGLAGGTAACCRVNELDFTGCKSVSGNTVSASFMKFTLVIE